jgi:hypothetical protein
VASLDLAGKLGAALDEAADNEGVHRPYPLTQNDEVQRPKQEFSGDH